MEYERYLDVDTDIAYCPRCDRRVGAIRYHIEEVGNDNLHGPNRATGLLLTPCMHSIETWSWTALEWDDEMIATKRRWEFGVEEHE